MTNEIWLRKGVVSGTPHEYLTKEQMLGELEDFPHAKFNRFILSTPVHEHTPALRMFLEVLNNHMKGVEGDCSFSKRYLTIDIWADIDKLLNTIELEEEEK